jgi:hypothetical protein
MGREEVQRGFWWGDLMQRDHFQDIGIAGRIILKWIFKKWDTELRTRLICRRIRTGGGALVSAVMNPRGVIK